MAYAEDAEVTPGATGRSKLIDILGCCVVAYDSQTHANLLRSLAGAIERAGEITAERSE